MSAMIYFILTGCYYVTFSPEALWVVEPKAKALSKPSRGTNYCHWHLSLLALQIELCSQRPI